MSIKAFRLTALIILFLIPVILFAETGVSSEKLKILFLPVRNIGGKPEHDYLEKYIYNVLRINLEKQPTLMLVDGDMNKSGLWKTGEFEKSLREICDQFQADSIIYAEYFIDQRELHLAIHVWDFKTLRIKNIFSRIMPADIDMLANIEKLCVETAVEVGRELPLLERDAFFQNQVIAGLRERIDREEKTITRVFANSNEIQLIPFTGLSLGKSLVSWSDQGPLLSPVIGLEYSRFLSDSYHIRAGFEYLPFDLLYPDRRCFELSTEFLFGFHTQSLFSMSLDFGLALTYTYNAQSAALSYYAGTVLVSPSAERLSLSIPVELGFSIFFNELFFINVRLKYYGLTWTFEPLDTSSYQAGNQSLKYTNGFSPWNFLCLSLSLQGGIRF